MSEYVVDTLPRLADVERAIDTIEAPAEDGPRTRTCLRLLVFGMRPCEVASLKPGDFDLPASAVLRSLPGLKVTVWAWRKRGPARRVRLEGPAAWDAKEMLRESVQAKTTLFTAQFVWHARKTLGERLGRPINAYNLRLVQALAEYEAIALLMRMH